MEEVHRPDAGAPKRGVELSIGQCVKKGGIFRRRLVAGLETLNLLTVVRVHAPEPWVHS